MKRVAAAAGLFLALWAFAAPELPRLCGFHWLTGRPCPLCGLTRAFFAMAKGHWTEAVQLHALSPLVLAMMVALCWKFPGRERFLAAGCWAILLYGTGRALLA
jgi:hypothetical protein